MMRNFLSSSAPPSTSSLSGVPKKDPRTPVEDGVVREKYYFSNDCFTFSPSFGLFVVVGGGGGGGGGGLLIFFFFFSLAEAPQGSFINIFISLGVKTCWFMFTLLYFIMESLLEQPKKMFKVITELLKCGFVVFFFFFFFFFFIRLNFLRLLKRERKIKEIKEIKEKERDKEKSFFFFSFLFS